MTTISERFVYNLFTIYRKPIDHLLKSRESALINALVYIDKVLGYKIRDINYVRYFMRRSEM